MSEPDDIEALPDVRADSQENISSVVAYMEPLG
jgi:hypothetical protein